MEKSGQETRVGSPDGCWSLHGKSVTQREAGANLPNILHTWPRKYHTQSKSFPTFPPVDLYIMTKPGLSSAFSMNYSVDQKSSYPEYPRLDSGVDMDQESCGSSTEEVESPRSVVITAAERRNRKGGGDRVRAHSQVLRIRAEDLHLGDDIGEGKLNKLGFGDFMLISRPILPASPLRGKTDGN